MEENNKIEFTNDETLMIKYALNNLFEIAEMTEKLECGFGFTRNDVYRLAEKLGIDSFIF